MFRTFQFKNWFIPTQNSESFSLTKIDTNFLYISISEHIVTTHKTSTQNLFLELIMIHIYKASLVKNSGCCSRNNES